MALRTLFRCSSLVVREFGALSKRTQKWTSAVTGGTSGGSHGVLIAPVPPVRHYARALRRKAVPESQLSDLQPSLLRMDYAAVPAAQTTDDLVRRLISLELACHSDKLRLKKEQLVQKVRRDENDRSSVEVKVAVLTARIRNFKEHLQKHHKDKANKRHMLLAVDQRKKLLKRLRLVNHEAFQRVCTLLDISYSFPPEYYRPATRRWLAKKALCMKVYQEVQKHKADLRLKLRKEVPSSSFSSSSSQ
ncbi:small ribosomal subunit protein uS15m [Gadus macrocephalus]|uniref:small ribosomal subunit protein uS15m n=1 Tax=Gadus macrocephalus TaxID=80720 RepID=UPI0028CBB71C|nr:small ribosomal subunit protein uS15m [Gadus macrocephalus]